MHLVRIMLPKLIENKKNIPISTTRCTLNILQISYGRHKIAYAMHAIFIIIFYTSHLFYAVPQGILIPIDIHFCYRHIPLGKMQ